MYSVANYYNVCSDLLTYVPKFCLNFIICQFYINELSNMFYCLYKLSSHKTQVESQNFLDPVLAKP